MVRERGGERRGEGETWGERRGERTEGRKREVRERSVLSSFSPSSIEKTYDPTCKLCPNNERATGV